MKFFVIACVIVMSAHCLKAEISDKIDYTKSKIEAKKAQERKITQKLGYLAMDIKKQKQKLIKLKKDISSAKKKIKKLKSKMNIKSSKLKDMEKLYKELKKREKEVNKKMTAIISKEIAITMINEGGDENNFQNIFDIGSDDIVFNEILGSYSSLLKEKFAKTKKRYMKLQKNRVLIQTELKKIESRLKNLFKEQDKLKKLQNIQSITIDNLRKKESSYIRKLARIKKEKNNLSQVLQKLKITKKKKEQTVIKATKNSVNVRRIGSSYQKGDIARYKGPKTISPLKNYTITQKFGNYQDPIYKIKIFNEAVSLKPKSPNSTVRNVLDGKIVYASKTPMLDFVVIVEHPNRLHTIYAHLSKLAPTIKVGKKVKSGYVIGRVNNALTFEVTQNEKHINPMELIR